MNQRDRDELEAMTQKLNQWEWPRQLGSRPPRAWTVEDNDDIRIAYRILVALSRWAARRRERP